MQALRFLTAILCAAACAAVFALPARAQDVVRFIAHDYAPFYSKQPMPGRGLPGMGNGYAVDMVRAAYKAVGVDVEIRFEPLIRSMHSLEHRAYAGLIGSRNALDATPSTAEMDSINLSSFHTYLHYFRSARGEEKPAAVAPSDLAGHSVAIILGSPARRKLEEAGMRVEPTVELRQGLMMLHSGRVEFWHAIDLTARMIVSEDLPEAAGDLTHPDWTMYEGSVDLNLDMLYPDYELRRRQFLLGMRHICDDGTLVAILESYFGKDAVPAYAFPGDCGGPGAD